MIWIPRDVLQEISPNRVLRKVLTITQDPRQASGPYVPETDSREVGDYFPYTLINQLIAPGLRRARDRILNILLFFRLSVGFFVWSGGSFTSNICIFL